MKYWRNLKTDEKIISEWKKITIIKTVTSNVLLYYYKNDFYENFMGHIDDDSSVFWTRLLPSRRQDAYCLFQKITIPFSFGRFFFRSPFFIFYVLLWKILLLIINIFLKKKTSTHLTTVIYATKLYYYDAPTPRPRRDCITSAINLHANFCRIHRRSYWTETS